MKNEAKSVVSAFLTAVQNGDNEKLATLLHPSVTWSQPGENQISGIKNSNAEVFQMVGKMFELSANSLRLTEVTMIGANGNKASCVLRWTANRPDGNTMEVDNIDVYTVENGQIVQAEIFSADLEKENQFWA